MRAEILSDADLELRLSTLFIPCRDGQAEVDIEDAPLLAGKILALALAHAADERDAIDVRIDDLAARVEALEQQAERLSRRLRR